jgi:hypothetical protein
MIAAIIGEDGWELAINITLALFSIAAIAIGVWAIILKARWLTGIQERERSQHEARIHRGSQSTR